MQIHEIFRRRTNEGVLKGVSVAPNSAPGVGSAIAHNLAGKLLQKVGLPASLGDGSEKAGFGAARNAAANVNEPLIKQQAKAAMDKWNESLVNLPGGLTPENKASMQRGLWRELHNNMMRGRLGNNFKNLPGMVWQKPDVQENANNIVSAIQQAFNAIANKPTNTTLQDWESLARSAYQAMSLAQFENARSSEIKLTPQEEARRQVQIDKLKNEIVAKERKVEEIKQKIETGDYTVQTKAIAQNAIKDLESTREAYLELTMNRVPGKANKDIAAPTATPKPTTPVAQAPAAETPEQRRRRLQALAQQNADRSATPVATPTPGFGKGTPMSMNPYQVPGARTTATPVKPATPAPTGPRVVAGGPTPAEREQLARRIAQASGTKV